MTDIDTQDIVGMSILDTLTTALYEDPIVIFREYIQNSVDASKDNPERVVVRINIDKNQRRITVTDDGPGIDPNHFADRMLQIAKSEKKNSIGFRGIGRLSAIPFCSNLILKSKYSSSDHYDVCTWNGSKYLELLNGDRDLSLKDCLKQITDFTQEDASVADEHGFTVIIEDYGPELSEVVGSKSFISRLQDILPLDYSKEFTAGDYIKLKMKEVLPDSDFDRFVCKLYLNDTEIYKKYRDDLIGSLKINYQPLKIKSSRSDELATIGLIWYTADKSLIAPEEWKEKEVDGLQLRSKNMGMGTRKVIARYASLQPDTTTERELVAAISSISGEVLIDTNLLSDDSKREWFKTSAESNYLIFVLSEFLMRTHRCRYAISNYRAAIKRQNIDTNEKNANNVTRKKTLAVNSLKEFTNRGDEDCIAELNRWYRILNNKGATSVDEPETDKKETEPANKDIQKESTKAEDQGKEDYASHDIPDEDSSKKDFYNDLMECIKKFMWDSNNKILFEKMRNHIRNNLRDKE